MKINGWHRIGIIASAIWLISGIFAYFHEISNHPSWLNRLPQSAYHWVEDIEFTQKAHQDAQIEGRDFSNKYVFLKPTFKVSGFLSFTLAPIALSWIVFYLVLYIIRWVKLGFKP